MPSLTNAEVFYLSTCKFSLNLTVSLSYGVTVWELLIVSLSSSSPSVSSIPSGSPRIVGLLPFYLENTDCFYLSTFTPEVLASISSFLSIAAAIFSFIVGFFVGWALILKPLSPVLIDEGRLLLKPGSPDRRLGDGLGLFDELLDCIVGLLLTLAGDFANVLFFFFLSLGFWSNMSFSSSLSSSESESKVLSFFFLFLDFFFSGVGVLTYGEPEEADYYLADYLVRLKLPPN